MSNLKNGLPAQNPQITPTHVRQRAALTGITDSLKANRYYLITLLAATWLSNYLYFQEWGFYEDDWMLLGTYFTSFGNPLYPFKVLLAWPSGRPLGNFFAALAGLTGSWFNSITLLYVFGFVILFLNTILIFFLFRTWACTFHAFLIALFFLLCPLDTTRMFLTHSFFLQISLFFSLSGMLLIAHQRPVAGYAIAGLSLLTYETGFLLLAAAPFFHTRRVSVRLWKAYLVHYIIIATILVLYIVIRSHIGDSRIATVSDDLMAFIWQTLHAVGYDLAHAARIIGYMAMWPWRNPSLMGLLLTGAIFTLIVFLYRHCLPREKQALAFDIEYKRLAELLFIALLIMVASYFFSAYLLSEYRGEIPLAGRGTRVHGVASIGYAVIMATVVVLIMNAARKAWTRRMALTLCAFIVGLHAYYMEKIQSDYSWAWDHQLKVISMIMPFLLDKKPGQVILYDETINWNPDPMAISPIHWAYNIILPSLIDWEVKRYLDAPVLIPLTRTDWIRHIQVRKQDKTLVPKAPHLVSGLPGLADMNWKVDNITLIRLTRVGFKRFRFETRRAGAKFIEDPVRYSNDSNALMNRPLQRLATVLFTPRELRSMGLWNNLKLSQSLRDPLFDKKKTGGSEMPGR